MAVQLPDPSVRQDAAENALKEREQKRRFEHTLRQLMEAVLADVSRKTGESGLGMELRNLALRMANHPLKPNEISPQAKQQLSQQPDLVETLAAEGVLSAAAIQELQSPAAPAPAATPSVAPAGPVGGFEAPVAEGAAPSLQAPIPTFGGEKTMTRLEAGAPSVLPEVT